MMNKNAGCGSPVSLISYCGRVVGGSRFARLPPVPEVSAAR